MLKKRKSIYFTLHPKQPGGRQLYSDFIFK